MNQTNPMSLINLFFALLSIVYIFGIFYFAGSPAVSLILPYNYYSLLHIPLYGVLTLLLALSLLPPRLFRAGHINPIHPMNQINETNQMNRVNFSSVRVRLFLAGLVSFMVGIADEYHQGFLPGREATVGDVLLDLAGVIAAILLIFRVLRHRSMLTGVFPRVPKSTHWHDERSQRS